METLETQIPSSHTRPKLSEENVHIIESKDPEVSKIQVTKDKSSAVANGGLKTPSSDPTVSSGRTSAPILVPTARTGQNGSLNKGTAVRASTGGIAETATTYINGGIFNGKRYSYAGSIASESMDMSISKGNMSISSRVS